MSRFATVRVGFLKILAYEFIDSLDRFFFVKPLELRKEFVFVFGCGHSGTSLLLDRLSRVEGVFAVPRETGNFIPNKPLYCARGAVLDWVAFAEYLGKDKLILEKTPKHVQCVFRIKRILPRARFLVVIRNPLDTCASLFERYKDIDFCIDRWNSDVATSLKVSSRNDAFLVRYEDLTLKPNEEFSKVLNFLCLENKYDLSVAGDGLYSKSSESGVMSVRKKQISQEIFVQKDRWRRVFSIDQARYVIEKTNAIAVAAGYAMQVVE